MMARMYGWGDSGPTAPSNCGASDNLCEHVRLEWSDNADNEDGYLIERDWTFLAELPANSESYNDLDAIPGQEYNYTIKAYNENDTASCEAGTGMRASSAIAPSGCEASNNLCDYVQITWTDNSLNEDGYHVIRDGSVLATLEPNIESYNDNDVFPGQEYSYSIEAFNACGGNQHSAGTGICYAKPGKPTLISPADGEDNLPVPVNLEWDSTGNMFMCQVDDNVDFVEPLIVGMDYLSSPRVEVSDNLQRGKKYYWRVRAHDDCGWGEWSDVFEFSTEYLRIMGAVFSQTDSDTIIHEIVELYRYGDSNPFKVTETYCVPTGKKEPGDSLTMYQFGSLLQDAYSIKFMGFWIYDGINLQDNYAGDSLNIQWTGLSWTNVEEIESGGVPESFSLFQNYPNPFNPRTRIEFSIAEDSYVTIEIFNIKGEIVKTLVHQYLSAGHKAITWDGEDESGSRVSSGIYFYRLTSDGFVSTKKMMLIK
jgi:hypothetical protein